jgi:hypothetical protein
MNDMSLAFHELQNDWMHSVLQQDRTFESFEEFADTLKELNTPNLKWGKATDSYRHYYCQVKNCDFKFTIELNDAHKWCVTVPPQRHNHDAYSYEKLITKETAFTQGSNKKRKSTVKAREENLLPASTPIAEDPFVLEGLNAFLPSKVTVESLSHLHINDIDRHRSLDLPNQPNLEVIDSTIAQSDMVIGKAPSMALSSLVPTIGSTVETTEMHIH